MAGLFFRSSPSLKHGRRFRPWASSVRCFWTKRGASRLNKKLIEVALPLEAINRESAGFAVTRANFEIGELARGEESA